MRRVRLFNPVIRAVMVIGVVAGLVTGVTYAALQSQATLTDNTISTTTVGLEVSANEAPFSASQPGFTIENLVPGVGADKTFSLKNTGGASQNASVSVPALPDPPAGPNGYGFSGFENLKVTFTSTDPGCSGESTSFTDMAVLNSPANVALPCGAIAPDAVRNYTAHFDILPSAITGSSAGVGVFNLVFTGTL